MSKVKQIKNYLIAMFLVIVIVVSSLAVYEFNYNANQPKSNSTVFVGVAFGGTTTDEAKTLIDEVKNYTNLFILDVGRNPISANQTTVEEIGDYAVSQGLSIIINMGVKDFTNKSDWNWLWQQSSLDNIKQRWTARWQEKFIGIYYNDELGGTQIAANWTLFYSEFGAKLAQMNDSIATDMNNIQIEMQNAMTNGTVPVNYDLEANFFVNDVLGRDLGLQELKAAGIPAFTSDYGLYWWDYLGGYNTVFTELGWNDSVAEQIALVKGAARLQDKQWGAMITWKYSDPPYLDSGDQIYNQMLTAYEAGAKYIAVFNYPYQDGSDFGTLNYTQLFALQRFWNDIHAHSFPNLSTPEAALVLPRNFGWGMRDPNDTIWGFWITDNRTQQIAIATSMLLTKYGANLDIVYEDSAYPVTSAGYQRVYYWNQTIIE